MTYLKSFCKSKFVQSQRGFSLTEIMVAVAIFVSISISIYQTYIKVAELIEASRAKLAVAALINEQFEIIRNIPYEDVGLVNGVPAGILNQNKAITRENLNFSITTTVRNIDDPFDGTVGGSPNDLSPADYKLVELNISCSNCKSFPESSFTTYVAPAGLENASDNGSLFVQVFDANGSPVENANIHIENNIASPPIIIDDVTNVNGFLQVVDTATGTNAYEITVSKAGYSSAQTYLPGEPANPNPEKPHATVATQTLTQVSFAIDKVSSMNIASVTDTCSSVGNIDFNLSGSKIIGPDILKYDEAHITDGSGLLTISNLEWDTYNIGFSDLVYDLIGTIPLLPITINPDMTQDLKLIVAPNAPYSILIVTKDTSTGLPVSGATVTLDGVPLITGRGFLGQLDWSGGAGQTDYIDTSKYFNSDGNVEINNPAGEVKLLESFGNYSSSGDLTSSTFDTGSPANFHQIIWQPQVQPLPTGTSSVLFQIATNNDNLSWEFKGPDGATSTFYDLSGTNINSVHNGDRYFRYKLFLSTESSTSTPIVTDMQFTFTSDCVPPGQTLFSGFSEGDYSLSVTADGYQTVNDIATISSTSTIHEINLSP